ncbi:MAG: fibrobacter succinogenes major paralogous domain-containing protein, partial [Bacteroidales bacterium]
MKKRGFILMFCLVVSQVMAQSPLGFTYQAVVRDDEGMLRSEELIALDISIVQGNPESGTVVFQEPHAPTTNKNGLLSVIIGSQNSVDFELIDWSNGPYFLQTYIDGVLMGATELVSVPYAMYSLLAERASSVEYSQVQNAPAWNDSIADYFQENIGYTVMQTDSLLGTKADKNTTYSISQVDSLLTFYDENAYSNMQIDSLLLVVSDTITYSNNEIDNLFSLKADTSAVYDKVSMNSLLNQKADTSVVYTKNQTDILLDNKANLSLVYSQTYIDNTFDTKADASMVYNQTYLDSALLSKTISKDLSAVAFSGDYNDLLNKPLIPTQISSFNNDVGYITMADMITEPEIVDIVLNNDFLQTETDPVFSSSLAANITDIDTAYWNAKSEFDGNYTSLTNLPDLSIYSLKSDVYTQAEIDLALAEKVNNSDLAIVATTGNYNDLLYKPTIPASVSELVNDAGYVSTDTVLSDAEVVQIVSDNGFLTTENDPLFSASPAFSISATDVDSWHAKSDFDGAYTSLTGTPDLSVYALNSQIYTQTEINDFLSLKVSTADIGAAALSNDYNDLLNRPAIPVNVSDLVNDSGFITDTDLQDDDPLNEVQTLALNETTLTISHANGNSVVFETWDTDSTNDVTIDDTQTITGDKTFTGAVTVNEPINSADAANKAYVDALETQVSVLETQISTLNDILLDAGLQGVVSDFEGNVYKTVKIGNQIWMAENLRSTYYADGTPIPSGAGLGDITGQNTSTYYFWYNDDIQNASEWGALYTWAAAMNSEASSATNPSGVQGVCPNGWHIPSDAEWKELEMSLGMSAAAADNTGGRETDEG